MGRKKRVIEKEWETVSNSQYDMGQKKQSLMGEFSDHLSDSVEEYGDMCFIEENENESAKKREKKERRASRRIVNKPASQPYIKVENGESLLCFKYPAKLCEISKEDVKKEEIEETEFSIKYDIESVDLEKLTDRFKADNSVYPRANVPFDSYLGNRWEYETEVNKLAWRLTALNPILLYGKKGIVQRAVDSFRNLHRSTSSRRVVRMKKLNDGTFRKRQHESAYLSSATVSWVQKGVTKKCKVRIDVDSVDYEKIDNEFKIKYSVFGGEFDEQSFGLGKWENMSEENTLAVKIAFLNVDNTSFWNSVKSTDKVMMLKKAVEAYKTKKGHTEKEDTLSNTSGYSEITRDEIYFLDACEINCKEKSFYYYL